VILRLSTLGVHLLTASRISCEMYKTPDVIKRGLEEFGLNDRGTIDIAIKLPKHDKRQV